MPTNNSPPLHSRTVSEDYRFRASSFSDSLDRHNYDDGSSNDDNNNNCDGSNRNNNEPFQISVAIRKTVTIPDPLQVDRCHRLPEYGPRILFFSGGSALKNTSAVLKHYSHNCIHLITPFDSGGSSFELRKAFDMISIGDFRNRLLALADESAKVASGSSTVRVAALFSHRLHAHDSLLATVEWQQILSAKHPLIQQVKLPMRGILLSHLRWFANRMPPDFNLCGASIGNLIITGCFLEHDRDIVTAIYLIWKLLGVHGIVRPITGANLHIRTYYEKNEFVQRGQHNMGKAATIEANGRIVKMDLVASLDDDNDTQQQSATSCHIDIVSSEMVASADVICFPMGSFFSSVLVNLLPQGVGTAIVKRHCPKVYIPNAGLDLEMHGYTLLECIEWIIRLVRQDAGDDVPIKQILSFVLVDTHNCDYQVDIDKDAIEGQLGIRVLDIPLVGDDDKRGEGTDGCHEKVTELDPTKVAEVLLTLGS